MGKRKTQEEFERDVFERLGPTYQLLSPYPGGHGKVEMRHTVCGKEFIKNVHDIISKSSGCPYCNGNRKALYTENWVKENTPLPFHYISGFQNMTTKCVFHCDKCGSDFIQTPARLINQKIYGCKCGRTKLKTHEEFLNELGSDTLKHYSINAQYVNSDTKITFTHLDCGTKFDLEPEKFLHRYHKEYCPVCYYKKSKGEVIITKTLTSLDIDFQREYIFHDFPKRRFDFYLPTLNVCIEFDGKQHFQQSSFFIEPLQDIQARDKEKNMYCLNNGITLYRISYQNIELIPTILTQILKEQRSETIEKYKVY